jgi:hypothetical protein
MYNIKKMINSVMKKHNFHCFLQNLKLEHNCVNIIFSQFFFCTFKSLFTIANVTEDDKNDIKCLDYTEYKAPNM